MRFLIDKFIQARDSVRIDPFEDQSLLKSLSTQELQKL